MDNSDGGTCYALIANEMVIPIVEDCKVNVVPAQALDETVRGNGRPMKSIVTLLYFQMILVHVCIKLRLFGWKYII